LDRLETAEQKTTTLGAALAIDLHLDIKAGYATRFKQSTPHH
jgi:hypothetical protein